jgi:hypothetical protein
VEKSNLNILNFENNLIAVKYVMLAGLATAIGLSYPLWLSEARYIPTTPLFDFFPVITNPFDYMLLYVTILVIAVAFIYPFQFLVNFSLLCLLLVLAFFDLNRLQPWLFHYILILIVFCSIRKDTKSIAIPSLQLLFCAQYFWGGIHKFNPYYFSEVVPWFAAPLGGGGFFHFIAFLVPALEVFIAIGLLFRKTRMASLVIATLIHVFSLYVVGPLGHNVNVVIWPWNLTMIAFIWLIFFRQEYYFINIIHIWRKPSVTLLAIVTLLLPVLHVFGQWPASLSFNLYSGNTENGVLFLGEGVREMLPEEVSSLVNNNKIYIKEWAMKELHVPGWVEKRAYLNARNFMYDYASDSSEVVLLFQRRVTVFGLPLAEFPE